MTDSSQGHAGSGVNDSASDPPGVPVTPLLQWKPFADWSEYIKVDEVQTAPVATAGDVVSLCNYAAKNGWKVRALGHSHNWSPLVLPRNTPTKPKTFLLDTGGLITHSATVVGGLAHATFGTGTRLDAATAYLASLDNGGAGAAPGFSFLNMPTPGGLSLGGILAVGGHGTGVPGAGPTELDLMGCLSNMIVSFKAVTTDPNDPNSDYEEREFDRSHPDAPAFLVHLGRAFLTEVTLAAVPNYYVQLTNPFPATWDLLAPPAPSLPPSALSKLLSSHGRVEAIWFPYDNEVWVQLLDRQTKKIDPQVPGPYNYGWMNWITKEISDPIRDKMVADPKFVLDASFFEIFAASFNMRGVVKNGTARDLEIYLTDNTLRMGIFGYALQIPFSDVQGVVNEFYKEFWNCLQSFNKLGHYPVNGAVEIRCTTIDRQKDLNIEGARPPALAATHWVGTPGADKDTVVLWLDVLSFPDTPWSYPFFQKLEQWMIDTWDKRYPNRLRPEWSKGWAYTEEGPWTNHKLITEWVPRVYNAAADKLTFNWAKQTLAKYDRAGIFTNSFLDELFA